MLDIMNMAREKVVSGSCRTNSQTIDLRVRGIGWHGFSRLLLYFRALLIGDFLVIAMERHYRPASRHGKDMVRSSDGKRLYQQHCDCFDGVGLGTMYHHKQRPTLPD